MAVTEVISITPADGWYALIGNNEKRVPLACWAVVRIIQPASSDCNVVGMIPMHSDRHICPVSDDPKFRGYQYGPFDQGNRVNPAKARKALAEISEMTEANIQDHIDQAKAKALFAAIAEHEIDSEYPELDE